MLVLRFYFFFFFFKQKTAYEISSRDWSSDVCSSDLAALVLGAVDHRRGAVDDVRVEPQADELVAGAVELDVRLEHGVEHRIWRQRVLVELIRAELGRRRALDDRRRDQLPAGALVEVAR